MAKRAVVIGSGPNGLAAALRLARAGVQVTVHEAGETIGGGCRTAELTLPGFRHDVCSAVLPLARTSPAFEGVDVEWIDPPVPAAHALDGDAVTLERSLQDTADGLGADAQTYRALVEPFVRAWPKRWSRWDFLRLRPTLIRGLLSARAIARLFETDRGRALFAGNAAHSVLPLERAGSAGFGFVLCAAAHVDGWAFARGGSQALADATAGEIVELGGEIVTSSRVDELPAADAVLCDVAPSEFARLARLPRFAPRFRHGPAAFKLDWALDGQIPWSSDACRRAATVHLGGLFGEIAASERAPWEGRGPVARPFVILVQHSLFDDSRAPAGKHTAWAYCHVPQRWDGDATEAIEAQVERFAPGFGDLILARHVMRPRDFAAYNANDVGGDIVGGANTLWQLAARPAPRLMPWRTPLRGVYLCSASTPPGGGVHGLCGLAAAGVALRDLA
jgi:phytoene dehydrogenase-like protein